jgi:hypothetical protein
MPRWMKIKPVVTRERRSVVTLLNAIKVAAIQIVFHPSILD